MGGRPFIKALKSRTLSGLHFGSIIHDTCMHALFHYSFTGKELISLG